jgi:hypothetical protein
MTKLELINKSLLPYLKGEKPYGVVEVLLPGSTVKTNVCRYYIPETGASCAVGQWLKEREEFGGVKEIVSDLFRRLSQSILKDEVQNILDTDAWDDVQCIHDQMAMTRRGFYPIKHAIKQLEELIEEPLTEIRSFVFSENEE